jgi:hypothetical protein
MPSVSLPIIDQLVHPSFSLLTRVAFPANPYSGPFIAVTPPQNALIALTYGVAMKINSVGAFHGRDVSFPVQYTPYLGKVAVSYTDLSALGITKQVEFWTYDDQVYFWDDPLPTLWTLYLAPDVTANLYYMQT